MRQTFFSLIAAVVAIALTACRSEPLKADAGPDFSVAVDATPRFNGCSSTGDIVNYEWTILSPPPQAPGEVGKVIRDGDASCAFTLERPLQYQDIGVWLIELEASDSWGNTSTDTVILTVTQQ